jgi:hypothetical protein
MMKTQAEDIQHSVHPWHTSNERASPRGEKAKGRKRASPIQAMIDVAKVVTQRPAAQRSGASDYYGASRSGFACVWVLGAASLISGL